MDTQHNDTTGNVSCAASKDNGGKAAAGARWPAEGKPAVSKHLLRNRKKIAAAAGAHATVPQPAALAQPLPVQGAWCPLLAAGLVLPKPSWRKRHPFLFWGGVLCVLALVFNAGSLAQYAQRMRGPVLGVVKVEGVILESDPTVNWIEKLAKDPEVKGILVRVNSPGGAVGPSQEMYAALKRAADKKPVVVSMGAMAASGGYYLALAGHQIFASPSTLTASIGVIMDVPNFEGLMGMLGISNKTLATGTLKGAGATTRAMTPEEEAYFRQLIGDMHDQFITTVAEHRGLPLARVKALADGRAMTGRQAQAFKLVDSLGDMAAARNNLMAMCNMAPGTEVVMVEGPPRAEAWLEGMVGSVLRFGAEQQAKLEQPRFWYQ